MSVERRHFLRASVGFACCAAGVEVVALAAPRRIAVEARKFQFTPSEITVRKGETVTFVLTSVDFPHGFSLPDFGVRKDLIPGMVLEVTITPANAGRFHYLCDNFCGDGHDRMSGILVVA
ncbi:hypothetical protein BWI17_10200 [Betaproteobacteria bacterium GR16-43]|nr:hypothetical protein BWI17_10200 [Betaproteobacteria bacterium GR16-43]